MSRAARHGAASARSPDPDDAILPWPGLVPLADVCSQGAALLSHPQRARGGKMRGPLRRTGRVAPMPRSDHLPRPRASTAGPGTAARRRHEAVARPRPETSSTRSARVPRRVPDSVLPIHPGRRCPGAGEPVERHVVEHRIARQARCITPARPFDELLHDPRAQGDRRVDQGVADRLWAGGLLDHVAGTLAAELRRLLARRPIPAAGHRVVVRRRSERHVQVDAGQPVGKVPRENSCNECAPVAALSSESLVTEATHELHPRRRNALRVPSRCASAIRRIRIRAETARRRGMRPRRRRRGRPDRSADRSRPKTPGWTRANRV